MATFSDIFVGWTKRAISCLESNIANISVPFTWYHRKAKVGSGA